MGYILVRIIFGWPAIITSLLVSIAGLLLSKPRLLVAGGVIIIPFSFYLGGGYPALRLLTILLPLFQFGAAWALRRGKKTLAWLLLAPLGIASGLLAVAVLTQ
jgi:hypothetical protein